MANLIIPDKSRHQYVVGIDIGHGETSAAIVPIEWDKSAGQRESDFQDIDLDSKLSVSMTRMQFALVIRHLST